jgi:hypothetical protein
MNLGEKTELEYSISLFTGGTFGNEDHTMTYAVYNSECIISYHIIYHIISYITDFSNAKT